MMMVSRFLLAGLMAAFASAAAEADGLWSNGARLEDARAGLSVVELGGRLYAIGGAGLTAPRDAVEVFDPGFGDWQPETPLPVGLERFGVAVTGGRIYVAGGYAAREGVRPIADMWSFDPAASVWQREPAMPAAKAGLVLAEAAGRLYAIGGEAGVPGFFAFDPESQEWETLEAPEDVARRGAAAAVIGDRIYFIGGVRAGVVTARVDLFDAASGEWSRGADMPAPRAGHAAAVLDGRIHVLGGRGADLSQTLSDHLVYTPATDGWAADRDLLSPRTDAGAVSLQGRIYLIGGGAGGGFFAPFTAIDSTDVFTPGH